MEHRSSASRPSPLVPSLGRRSFLAGVAVLGTAAALPALSACSSDGGGNGEVNFLAWPGHNDKSLIGPFEKETGIRVRVKEYADASQMVALATTSPPGTFDVLMVDPEFIQQLRTADALQPLDPDDYPIANTELFEEFRPEAKFPVHWYDGKMYALAWAFNYNSLAYNTDVFTAADAASYDVMMSSKAKGKVGMQDWWSNPLGPLSMWAGNKDPYNLTQDRFDALSAKLGDLRPQVGGFYPLANVIQNLGTGQIVLAPGAGSTFTVGLQRDGRPVASVVPSEGAVQYTESLALFKGAKNVQAAKKFINYCISAKGSAAKGILPAYQGLPANEKSWELIRQNQPEWAELLDLKATGPNALTPLREGRVALRRLPEQQSVEQWQEMFTKFKDA